MIFYIYNYLYYKIIIICFILYKLEVKLTLIKMNNKSPIFSIFKAKTTNNKGEKLFTNRKMKREDISLLNSLFSVLKRKKRISESTYCEETDNHHIEEKKSNSPHFKEDKEDTEDCSKIGETVYNEEDSERTITEESDKENKNEDEDSDDEVIDINKI